MNKSAIIFDLDGTLIDTPRIIAESLSIILKKMGFLVNDVTSIKATIGLPLEEAFSKLMGVEKDNDKIPIAIKYYRTLFRENILPEAEQLIFPSVAEGLKRLKSQGYSLAVATSKIYSSAEALLKAARLWDYFEIVVGADQVTQAKPHPEMGQLIIKKLKIPAAHIAMVGDTTHDILMGNNCGMYTIAVTYGVHDVEKLKSAKPTWLAETFDEVLECIDDSKILLSQFVAFPIE